MHDTKTLLKLVTFVKQLLIKRIYCEWFMNCNLGLCEGHFSYIFQSVYTGYVVTDHEGNMNVEKYYSWKYSWYISKFIHVFTGLLVTEHEENVNVEQLYMIIQLIYIKICRIMYGVISKITWGTVWIWDNITVDNIVNIHQNM